MKRPIGLVLTTVILGIIAFSQLMAGIMMVVGGVVGSHAPPPAAREGMPIPPQAVGSIVLYSSILAGIVGTLLAAWAIFTIVGLLRLRNWGRISVLIIGAFLAGIGLLATLGFTVLLFVGFLAKSSSTPAPSFSPHFMAIMFGIIALFYAIIAAIGIWWLVYFNRPAVKTLFVIPATGAYTQYLDPTDSLPPPSKPSHFENVPIAIVIIACLFLLSALSCAAMAIVPFPAFLFGLIITGPAKAAIYLTIAAVSGYSGYGLLHLDNRARLVTLAFLCFGFLQMLCIFLPWYRMNFNLYNQQIMQKFQFPGVPIPPTPDLSYAYVVVIGVIVIICTGSMFWLIQRHRAAFLRTPASN